MTFKCSPMLGQREHPTPERRLLAAARDPEGPVSLALPQRWEQWAASRPPASFMDFPVLDGPPQVSHQQVPSSGWHFPDSRTNHVHGPEAQVEDQPFALGLRASTYKILKHIK